MKKIDALKKAFEVRDVLVKRLKCLQLNEILEPENDYDILVEEIKRLAKEYKNGDK